MGIMKINNIFKKSCEQSCALEKEKYFNKYNNIISIIEKHIQEEDGIQAVLTIQKIVIEYLNYNLANDSIQLANNDSRNHNICKIYEKLALLYNSKNIKYTKKINKVVNIRDVPYLLTCWNSDRIIEKFNEINENKPLDKEKSKKYGDDCYLYPMNVASATGGCHSKLAATYFNSGQTIIPDLYDYSFLYKFLQFDGKDFIDVKNSIKIHFYDEYSDLEVYYSGILFEMGRYLLKSNYKNPSIIG